MSPDERPDERPARDPAERQLALRVVTMPRDTNPYGTIFGGVILSLIDQAGFVQALNHGDFTWVTASIERVDFRAAVNLGDIINVYTRTIRTGRTSVTIQAEVETERCQLNAPLSVTSATLTMVALNDSGKPTPFASA